MQYLSAIAEHPEIERIRDLDYEVAVPILLRADGELVVDPRFFRHGHKKRTTFWAIPLIWMCLIHRARRVILLHNHPTQFVQKDVVDGVKIEKVIVSAFSGRDVLVTGNILSTLRFLGIHVIDSIIVAEDNTMVSMRQLGYLGGDGGVKLRNIYHYCSHNYGQGGLFIWKDAWGYRLELRQEQIEIYGRESNTAFADYSSESVNIGRWPLPIWWPIVYWAAIRLNNVVPLSLRLWHWPFLIRYGADWIGMIERVHKLDSIVIPAMEAIIYTDAVE